MSMPTSNLGVRSNLMLLRDSTEPRESARMGRFPSYDDVKREAYRYLPGDLVKLTYPELAWATTSAQHLSPKQIHELQQYLVCVRCHNTCAGTCGDLDRR